MTPAVTAAFSSASDGDLRHDLDARRRFSARLGVSPDWATVHQVHGDRVVRVEGPGHHGDADALVTTRSRLPLAVFTADCLGIVIAADGGVGVAHAGWRGLVAGILTRTREVLETVGATPRFARIGPSIGPCCFEVGAEVADRFPDHVGETTWGTTSVDLRAAAVAELGLPVDVDDRCSRCGSDTYSHRRDRTTCRMAAVGWLS